MGVGVSGRPILRCPRSPFPRPNTDTLQKSRAGGGEARKEKWGRRLNPPPYLEGARASEVVAVPPAALYTP